MAWFADLAGKAETLLNNLDEQTGAALRNHTITKKKTENAALQSDSAFERKKRPPPRFGRRISPTPDNKAKSTEIQTPKPLRTPKEPLNRSYKPVEKDDLQSLRRRSPQRPQSFQTTTHGPQRTFGPDVPNFTNVDRYGQKHRRYSFPNDLEVLNNEELSYIRKLELENTVFSNELSIMKREITELLEKLQKSEDELVNQKVISKENDTLSSQMERLKSRIERFTTTDINAYKDQITSLQIEIETLRNHNLELEKECNIQAQELSEKNAAQAKLESELRHSQSAVIELRMDVERTTEECRRLEKDWEAYKNRVKSMLIAKDNEIKSMLGNLDLTTDSKVLMEQIDALKVERDYLTEAVDTVQRESNEMKSYIQKIQATHTATERALREALREERTARNRADSQLSNASKEFKSFQIETGQAIASLRSALQEKEIELSHFRDSVCNRTADSSALNVADYDVMHETIENNKIVHLTETLVQRQNKLDSLMAENNTLKIQLDKLNTKYKNEITNQRLNSHSVVHLQEGDSRTRSRVNTISGLSLRFAVMMKRYPILRTFFIIYMIFLHLWVLAVLCSSTPENMVTRPFKS